MENACLGQALTLQMLSLLMDRDMRLSALTSLNSMMKITSNNEKLIIIKLYQQKCNHCVYLKDGIEEKKIEVRN